MPSNKRKNYILELITAIASIIMALAALITALKQEKKQVLAAPAFFISD